MFNITFNSVPAVYLFINIKVKRVSIEEAFLPSALGVNASFRVLVTSYVRRQTSEQDTVGGLNFSVRPAGVAHA